MLALRWQYGDEIYERVPGRQELEKLHIGNALDAHREGGGGRVFEIIEYPEYAAKVFHGVRHDLNALLSEASKRQLHQGFPGLAIVAAPFGVLQNGLDGEDVGLTMRRVPPLDFVPLDKVLVHLANDPSDTNDLLEVVLEIARRLARAVAEFHDRCCVVGDLKPENLFVHEIDAYVFFVDVDALVFLDDRGQLVVGHASTTPGYRAPELVVGAIPTYGSDQFALATIVTQLLLCGFHPFGYTRRGRKPSASDQERIVATESWVTDASAYHAPLPLGLDALPPELAGALRKSLTLEARTSAVDLADLLDDVKVGECGRQAHRVLVAGRCVHCAAADRADAKPVRDVAGADPETAGGTAAPKRRSRRLAFALGALAAIAVLVVLLLTLLIDSGSTEIDTPTPETSGSGVGGDESQAAPRQSAGEPSSSADNSGQSSTVVEMVPDDPTSTVPETLAPTSLPPAPTWTAWDDNAEADLLATGQTFRALFVRSRVTDERELCIVPASPLGPDALYALVVLQPCDGATTPSTTFTPKPTPMGTRYEASIELAGLRFCLGPTAEPTNSATVLLSYDLCSDGSRDLLNVFVDLNGQLGIQAFITDGAAGVVDVDFGRSEPGSSVQLYRYDEGRPHQRLDLMWIEVQS